jgi:hypothetical protein
MVRTVLPVLSWIAIRLAADGRSTPNTLLLVVLPLRRSARQFDALARHQHALADQVDGVSDWAGHVGAQRFQRGIDLVDAGHGRQLGQLAGHGALSIGFSGS